MISKNVESIVIVGGGSAGWMSAAALIKFFPEKKITVVESKNTPPIGVGESTYEGIRYFCAMLGIDNTSFFKHTDASIKLGICFTDFYEESGYPTFQYPFGPPLLEGTTWGLEDWLIKKSVYKDTPVTEYAESYFPQALLAKHGRFSENLDGKFGTFRHELDTALHFDAIKYGRWLRDFYCVPRGVQHVVDDVVNVNTDAGRVTGLSMQEGYTISADLYVDCTGFTSLLLDKSINEPFISYNDVLPNNRAWATRVKYKDKEKELKPLTTCTALKNGWVWDIPLWSRLGTGYVYSDKYTTKEDALEEFKNYLMSDKMTVSQDKNEVEELDFIDIGMRVGIHRRTWVGNVVAIGLSAGFIEPLESNGLFTVHDFLYQLIRTLQRGKVSQWDVDVYNNRTQEIYDSFVNFIRIHYSLSVRTDSPYWQANFARGRYLDKNLILSKNLHHIEILQDAKTKSHYVPREGGIPWISTGMNYHILDDVSIAHGQLRNGMDYAVELQPAFDFLDRRRSGWESHALQAQTLYDYLRTTYYEGEHV